MLTYPVGDERRHSSSSYLHLFAPFFCHLISNWTYFKTKCYCIITKKSECVSGCWLPPLAVGRHVSVYINSSLRPFFLREIKTIRLPGMERVHLRITSVHLRNIWVHLRNTQGAPVYTLESLWNK